MLELPFHQVAFVVRDLDVAVRRWADDLGVGPWHVWTMDGDRIHDTVWHGERVPFAFRHALAWAGDQQFELVQPLNGPSIFADQLAEHDDGYSHIGVIVSDHPAAVAELESRGFVALQSARFGASEDGRFAYLRRPGLPTIVELIRPPTTRYPPDYVYPEPEA